MPDNYEDSYLPVRYRESRPLVPAAADRSLAAFHALDLSVSPFREYVGLLLRRKWTVIAAASAMFGAACLITASSPRVYEAAATMLVSKSADTSGGASSGQDQMPLIMAAMTAPDIETHATLIQSRSTADATAAWLKEHGGPNLSAADLSEAVYAGIVPKTRLLRISARARSADDARKIANAAASAYAEMNQRRARGSSESASRYLTKQLTIAKDKLASAEDALRAFKESTRTVAPDAAASNLLRRAASLRADVDETRADLAAAKERLSEVGQQLAHQNESIGAARVRDNAVVEQLRAKLVDLEGQRLLLQSQYTSAFSAPLNQIDEQIRITRDQLNSEIRNIIHSDGGDLAMQQALVGQLIQGEAEVAALKARERQLQGEVSKSDGELERIPALQIALARLERQVQVAQGIYSDLLRRSQEIEVGRVMALGNTDVVELADTPLLPIKPNMPLNLTLGMLLGLAVGIGLALLQEQLDDTVRDEDDVVRFAGAPVLATIPVFNAQESTAALPGPGLRGRANDAYRSLLVNLSFVTPGAGGHTVLVTSAGPQEGKTTTALNLAIAAAQSGRQVVLVDSDLRRPSIHRLLSLNGRKGLSNLLAGQARVSDVLRRFEETRLRFISSGTRVPTPTDLLDSSEMRSLVEKLRREADLVIFDGPPILFAPDGLVLANLSDAVLMVCVPAASHRRALQRARLLLDQIGQKVSGVVLNKVRQTPSYGYQSQYHYYSDYPDSNGGDSPESARSQALPADQSARTP